MHRKSNTEIRHLAGEIYIEAEIMHAEEDRAELQRITDISFMVGGKGKTVYVSLAGFTNVAGQSVAEIIEQEAATIEALIDMQDQAERAEAQATRAEDILRR